jgi:ribonuclease HII
LNAKDNTDRFTFEKDLLTQNLTCIAGVDEAGRGPLAGPVVAVAVILPADWITQGVPPQLEGLNDSKQLTEAQREKYFEVITTTPGIQYGIAQVDSTVIDQINILKATWRAMVEALAKLENKPQHVLVDGNRVRAITLPQTPIVKGDARSYSIAAASVLAKVTRDRMMLAYDRQWPEYGFAKHKGYGTAEHLQAIVSHGPCAIHRLTFAPLKKPAQQELF